jgi:hypothetical protein
MTKVCAPLIAWAVLAVPAFAQAPLMCFGNEPSWKVDLGTRGVVAGSGGGGTAATAPPLEGTAWRLESLPGKDAKPSGPCASR